MFLVRSIKILVISIVGAISALMPALLAGLCLLWASQHPALSLNATAAGLLGQYGQAVAEGPNAFYWQAGLLWLATGGIFLRHQIHMDGMRKSVARREDTPVALSLTSLGDVVVQVLVALVAGPLMVLVQLFRRPHYAFVAPEPHYRHRLVYTDRPRRDMARGARPVFDSRAYGLALLLELCVWAGIIYLIAFDHSWF